MVVRYPVREFDDRRPGLVERRLQRVLRSSAASRGPDSGAAQRLGQLRQVGRVEVDADGLDPLLDHLVADLAVAAVVGDDHRERELELRRRGELGDGEHAGRRRRSARSRRGPARRASRRSRPAARSPASRSRSGTGSAGARPSAGSARRRSTRPACCRRRGCRPRPARRRAPPSAGSSARRRGALRRRSRPGCRSGRARRPRRSCPPAPPARHPRSARPLRRSCRAGPGRCRPGSGGAASAAAPTGRTPRAPSPPRSPCRGCSSQRCTHRSRIEAPSDSGCRSSTTPFPLTVVTIGSPSASAASPAPRAPPPSTTAEHKGLPLGNDRGTDPRSCAEPKIKGLSLQRSTGIWRWTGRGRRSVKASWIAATRLVGRVRGAGGDQGAHRRALVLGLVQEAGVAALDARSASRAR